jgi:long-subunit fatty acid transport protein
MMAVVAVFAMPAVSSAQSFSSSINTYSPYSMYGLGELATPGNVAMRSMGGVGLGMYSYTMVNLLNPAAYGNMTRKSFIFDFGVDAGHYRNSQLKSANSLVKTAYNSVNFHEIAFQMPLAKNVGFGFSLTPYSNVGYKMYRDEMAEDILGNIGRVRYMWDGEGDITEVKAGVAWRPFKHLSIGAAMLYYWGNISRNYTSQVPNIITGSGSYSSTTGLDTFDVSKIKMQAGLQWHIIMNTKRVFTLGATYDLGGSLTPDVTERVYVANILQTEVRNKNVKSALSLPQQIAAGLFYQTNSLRVGVDYVYQDWADSNVNYTENLGKGVEVTYNDTHTVKFGIEYTPRPSDVRNYMNRIAYRIGTRVGDYYQNYGGSAVHQYAITAGLGLPLQLFGGSSVDVGFEYGMRRPDKDVIMVDGAKVGLVNQNYFKLSIGLSFFSDRWFMRYKFD